MAQEPIVTDIIAAIGTHTEAMRLQVEGIINTYVGAGGDMTRQYEATIDAYNTVIAALRAFRHIEVMTENADPTPGFGTGLEDD